jgi:hypothetical protein
MSTRSGDREGRLCLRWHRSPDRCAFMPSPLSSSERTERTSSPKAFSNLAGGQTSEASATPGRATPLRPSRSPKDCTQRRGPPPGPHSAPHTARADTHRPCRHAAHADMQPDRQGGRTRKANVQVQPFPPRRLSVGGGEGNEDTTAALPRPKAFSNIAGGQTSEASATPGRATPLRSSRSPKDCTQRRGPTLDHTPPRAAHADMQPDRQGGRTRFVNVLTPRLTHAARTNKQPERLGE